MKKFYLGLLISLFSTAIFAQDSNPQSNSKTVYSNWKTFDNSYLDSPEKLFSEKKANFGLSKNDELQLKSQKADELAIEHKRYQQYYKV